MNTSYNETCYKVHFPVYFEHVQNLTKKHIAGFREMFAWLFLELFPQKFTFGSRSFATKSFRTLKN